MSDRVPISTDLRGFEFKPRQFSWTRRDVVIYALAVGAEPDGCLNYLFEKHGPAVLPAFASVAVSTGLEAMMSEVEIDFSHLLHAGQELTFLSQLPAAGELKMDSRIIEVWDKGEAALLEIESCARNGKGVLFQSRSQLYVRGAGNFGGARAARAHVKADVSPDAEPDFTVYYDTKSGQAALYRLLGDENPIHIDPNFATRCGLSQPCLHGLCVYGIIGRILLFALCDGVPERLQNLKGRFSSPVYCGDRLITKIWKLGNNSAVIAVENHHGVPVFKSGFASFHVNGS